MPSLYKSNAVQGEGARAVPVSQLAVKPPPRADSNEESENVIQAMVEERVTALLAERWKQAQFELAALREKLHAEVAEARRQALEAARKDGYEDGLNKAKAEAQKLMHEVELSYKRLEVDRQGFIASCREDITNLVMDCTQSLLQEELQTAPEVIANLISRAIAELVSKQKVVVFVHPERLDTVSAYSYLLPTDGQAVIVRPDPTLPRDSCKVCDELGSVLIDLPDQLRRMKQVLAND